MAASPTKLLLMATTLACSLHSLARAAGPADIFALPDIAGSATSTGRLAPAARLRIVVALNLRDPAGAEQFVHDVSTPGSPRYGLFLSPADFAARFGATGEDYAALASWARAHGLQPGPQTASRTTLSLRGDVATLERLFATQLAAYVTPDGQPAYAPLVTPTLPAELEGRVAAVIGLASGRQFAPLLKHADLRSVRPLSAGGSGVGGAYSPEDFRTAYDVPPQPGAASSETVAVFEQGGFAMDDVATFAHRYGLPKPPVKVRAVDGSGTGTTSGDVALEAVLDIDTILGVNPAVGQIIAYEDGTDPFPVALLDSLSAMADDDGAQTISISYGQAEALTGRAAAKAEHTVLLQLAAQGQTVYASAGDSGAYLVTRNTVTLAVNDPASQPQVTGVGGTTLFTGFGSIYSQENAWNSLDTGFGGATGGGISNLWQIPDYQVALNNSVFANAGGSSTNRNVPDVTADGDVNTGASLYSRANGGWLIAGGTSLSAPLWAGFSSILNATRVGVGLPRLGFFNPMIYTLGLGGFGIHDIVNGSNGNPNDYVGQPGLVGYFAASGADNVSGFGSFDGRLYLGNLLGQNLIGDGSGPPSRIAAPSAVPGATGVALSWKAAKRDLGYLIEVFPTANPAAVTFAATRALGVTVTGLAAGTDYGAVVLPTNAYGESESPVTRFTTPPK